jgi:branched-chain amino acid transport system permease protein
MEAGSARLRTLLPVARRNADLVAFAAAIVCLVLLPRLWPFSLFLTQGAPLPVVLLGAVGGASLALQTLGMVLVLKTTRVINFGQVQLGAVTGLLFYELVSHVQGVVWLKAVCSGCLPGVNSDATFLETHPTQLLQMLQSNGDGGWIVANFWLSVLVSLVLAPLISWVVYLLVIRRFSGAPRLIVTVVTVAVSGVLIAVAGWLAGLFTTGTNNIAAPAPFSNFVPIPNPSVQLAWKWPWDPKAVAVVFHLADFLSAIVAGLLCVGLVLFFRYHRAGIAIRGVADNERRAQTLGIPVSSLASLSWAMAGLLAGIAAILATIASGGASGAQAATSSFDIFTLVELLAAVAVARFASLPLAVGASIAVGVIAQLMSWNFSNPAPLYVVLLVIVGGALLLQRSRQSRAEQEAAGGYLASREARPVPEELRHLPVVQSWRNVLVTLLAGAALILPFALDTARVDLLAVIFIYALVSLSILVLTGWAGQISLGQWAIAAVGAYVTAILGSHGVFFLVAIALGGLAAAGVSVAIGVPALRLRGLYYAATSLAFSLAATAVLLDPNLMGGLLPRTLDRPNFLGFSLDSQSAFYFLCLAVLIGAVVMVKGVRRSRTGRVLIACRDNELAAQSFGISLTAARLQAFALSGFLAGVAGGLFAYQERAVQAIGFDPLISIYLFLNTVTGGLGSVLGAILGAFYYGAVFLFTGSPIVLILFSSVGVLAILLLFPGGLASIWFAARDATLRRIAIRYRIVVPSLLADRGGNGIDAPAQIAPKMVRGSPEFVPIRYRVDENADSMDAPARAEVAHG